MCDVMCDGLALIVAVALCSFVFEKENSFPFLSFPFLCLFFPPLKVEEEVEEDYVAAESG